MNIIQNSKFHAALAIAIVVMAFASPAKASDWFENYQKRSEMEEIQITFATLAAMQNPMTMSRNS